MKRFSTVRDTQRGSQSYKEKRRGRRDIEVTRRRRGGIKRGKSNLASKQFSICSLQLEPSERFMELHRAEKREEGDRGEQEEKKGVIKRREIDLGSTLFPKCSPQPRTHRFTELG